MEQDKEKTNVFLNAVGQLNRDMYYMDSKQNTPVSTFAKPPIVPQSSTIHSDKSRFNSDVILNKGVKEKNEKSDDSRLIVSLMEEIKNLKDKMSFVIEKDEEIYRLECENKLLQKRYAELQQTQVTDESLSRDNGVLRDKLTELESHIEELTIDNINLKKKLVILHRQKTAPEDKSEGYILNIASIKNKLLCQNIKNVDSVLLSTILKYKLSDKQWVPKDTMNMIMKEMLLGCKLATQDI